MIVIVDCFRCGAGVGIEDTAFLDLVDRNVETCAKVDRHTDLEVD